MDNRYMLTVHEEGDQLVFNFKGNEQDAINVIDCMVQGIIDGKVIDGADTESILVFGIKLSHRIDDAIRDGFRKVLEVKQNESSREESEWQ